MATYETILKAIQSGYDAENSAPRDIDKINAIFNTIGNIGKQRQASQKTDLENKLANLQQKKIERELENDPFMSVPLGLKEPVDNTAEIQRIKQENMRKIQEAKQRIAGMGDVVTGMPVPELTPEPENAKEKFNKLKIERLGYDPFVTRISQAKDLAGIEATRALGQQRLSPKVNDLTPIVATAQDELATGGLIKAGTNTTLGAIERLSKKENVSIQAQGREDRQEKAFKFREALEIKKELQRIAAEERAMGRQELKEIRPKIQGLDQQIALANEIKNQLEYAIDSGIDVTGLLSVPVNRLKEVTDTLPAEQQKILTALRLNFADFVRERGGTAFTDTEKKVFGPIMPEESVGETTNLNRINTMLDIMNNKKALLNSYSTIGTLKSVTETGSKDQYQVGQTVTKNGKTYSYIGGGKWQAK